MSSLKIANDIARNIEVLGGDWMVKHYGRMTRWDYNVSEFKDQPKLAFICFAAQMGFEIKPFRQYGNSLYAVTCPSDKPVGQTLQFTSWQTMTARILWEMGIL